ncbi:MAG: 50S ribosomal protein L17 [Nitrospirae bacterium RBG_19FT_COMBO_42_15]|nr:MAG: 50S ribosomal protein L17 [Nitrospirae bacterium RBG_19FT_COMBO_42_15]
MRHGVRGRQLGRNTSHRRALFRTLVTSVLDKEKIETTVEKAKEIRPMVERMITYGKRGDLNSRRIAASFISTRDVVKKLFDTIAPRFKDRNGGYTRIIRTRRRVGDAAEMAVIELLGAEVKPEEKKEEKKAAAKKAKVEAKAKTEKPAKKEKEAKPKSKEAKAPKAEKAKEKPKEKAKKKAKEKESPQ